MTANAWYRTAVIACVAFFVLSIVSMLIYPGGRIGDRNSIGYDFFNNFFSDLGQTQTHNGTANVPSLVLFCLALASVAYGMSAFFITFTQMFARVPAAARMLAIAGATAGCASALCFLGVAATPWNLVLRAHNTVTGWAFQAFLAAVLCDLAAVLIARAVSKRFALVFALFAIVLAAYVALLMFGPRLDTADGARVQAIGQKIIVYASTLTIFAQALLARRLSPPLKG